ncbi:MAG: adenylate/guanylate cyclase domain-containing protein [Geodermatophilaceae bacterium]
MLNGSGSQTLLPAGTLTLLFSDIEGSTNLLSMLGAEYAGVLSAQREILRAAITGWHGREMGTEGDSFFVVFATVSDAVNAAVQAQRQLAVHDWPANARVLVRIGVHTGEPARHEDGYVGMDVHRAARVAASAHGVRSSSPRRRTASPARSCSRASPSSISVGTGSRTCRSRSVSTRSPGRVCMPTSRCCAAWVREPACRRSRTSPWAGTGNCGNWRTCSGQTVSGSSR